MVYVETTNVIICCVLLAFDQWKNKGKSRIQIMDDNAESEIDVLCSDTAKM